MRKFTSDHIREHEIGRDETQATDISDPSLVRVHWNCDEADASICISNGKGAANDAGTAAV